MGDFLKSKLVSVTAYRGWGFWVRVIFEKMILRLLQSQSQKLELNLFAFTVSFEPLFI